MLRIVGAMCIVAGAGGFGCLMAAGLSARVAAIERLSAALQHLESDITYASLPLAEALERAARAAGGEAGSFLRAVAHALAQNDGRPLARIWREAVTACAEDLMLAPVETEAMARLGAVLGGSDRQDQQKHLALARASLARFQAEAEAREARAKRVWQYLGFSLGAMAAIILY